MLVSIITLPSCPPLSRHSSTSQNKFLPSLFWCNSKSTWKSSSLLSSTSSLVLGISFFFPLLFPSIRCPGYMNLGTHLKAIFSFYVNTPIPPHIIYTLYVVRSYCSSLDCMESTAPFMSFMLLEKLVVRRRFLSIVISLWNMAISVFHSLLFIFVLTKTMSWRLLVIVLLVILRPLMNMACIGSIQAFMHLLVLVDLLCKWIDPILMTTWINL